MENVTKEQVDPLVAIYEHSKAMREKREMQERYDELAVELESSRKSFHKRVDQIVDCDIDDLEWYKQSCEIWAGDIAKIRTIMSDIAGRISELEAGQ